MIKCGTCFMLSVVWALVGAGIAMQAGPIRWVGIPMFVVAVLQLKSAIWGHSGEVAQR